MMWGQPHSAVRRAQPGSGMSRRMRKKSIPSLLAVLLLASCSPRDFISRRLATDLISASDAFRTSQHFTLQTGIVSNKDYVSPEYLVLQQHGWISATAARCSPGMVPPPCWDVLLTPLGVDTVRALVPAEEADKSLLFIPVAKRELVGVTGISKQSNLADVEFTWKWVPLNEIGAALYSGDLHYTSSVGFREYDDGWRMLESTPRSGQALDDALKNAEPSQ
ncbi:MAG: hypothetical protein WA830_26205 [Candidatus Sulfotelmatobacter sp.]